MAKVVQNKYTSNLAKLATQAHRRTKTRYAQLGNVPISRSLAKSVFFTTGFIWENYLAPLMNHVSNFRVKAFLVWRIFFGHENIFRELIFQQIFCCFACFDHRTNSLLWYGYHKKLADSSLFLNLWDFLYFFETMQLVMIVLFPG